MKSRSGKKACSRSTGTGKLGYRTFRNKAPRGRPQKAGAPGTNAAGTITPDQLREYVQSMPEDEILTVTYEFVGKPEEGGP